ncbi:HAD-like domain-containing protein [Flagelloscypha sp. PMI_526]|nr:HAD-like domain-containing protein [Flagelloscypha sp. PMI_526]
MAVVEHTILDVDAILFDMDGTLIDSTPGVLVAWDKFTAEYGVAKGPDDYLRIAHEAHGRRLVDSLVDVCGLVPGSDKLKDEVQRFEEEVIKGGPTVLPGANDLLTSLVEQKAKWTIVTSASTWYATNVLPMLFPSLPLPQCGIVTADNSLDVVKAGKPAPDPYLAGAHRLGTDPTRCLVIEDAMSGFRAGKAAGAKVLAVATSSSREIVEKVKVEKEVDAIATKLTKVSARISNVGGISVVIDESP